MFLFIEFVSEADRDDFFVVILSSLDYFSFIQPVHSTTYDCFQEAINFLFLMLLSAVAGLISLIPLSLTNFFVL